MDVELCIEIGLYQKRKISASLFQMLGGNLMKSY
jgi:hypothetical protein